VDDDDDDETNPSNIKPTVTSLRHSINRLSTKITANTFVTITNRSKAFNALMLLTG